MVYARQAVQGLPAEKPQERRLDVRGVASRQEAREPGNEVRGLWRSLRRGMVYARQAVQGLPAEKPQERRLDVRGVASRQEAREPGNGRARGAARAGRRLMSAAEIDDYLGRLDETKRTTPPER